MPDWTFKEPPLWTQIRTGASNLVVTIDPFIRVVLGVGCLGSTWLAPVRVRHGEKNEQNITYCSHFSVYDNVVDFNIIEIFNQKIL